MATNKTKKMENNNGEEDDMEDDDTKNIGNQVKTPGSREDQIE